MLCLRINYVLNKLYTARCVSYSAMMEFQDIPTPRGLPLIGNTLALLAAGGPPKLHEYIDRRHKELGPIFKDNIGPVTAVFLSDPDDMRAVFAQEGKCPFHIKPEPWLVYNARHNYIRGLFFMDGEEWLEFRRIMNKLLLKGDLSWLDNSCDAASDSILDRILPYSETNSEFPNLERELYKWSLDVIVSVLLGANAYREARAVVEPLVDKLASTIHSVFETTSKLMLFPAAVAAKYNIPRWKRFENSVEAALKSSNEIIDLLRDNFQSGDGLLRKMEKEKMSKVEINRIVADLIIAGGDTTAYTMEWMLYLIAKNKVIQPGLRNGDKTLLKNVLKETLRLYPVAPFLNRFLPDNGTVGGYNIPAGTLMVMSIYTSGRDEKYFKNPGEFLPDRWLRSSTQSAANIQHASLPFAIGARSCIGKKIAEAQLQMALSKIVSNFDVELCNHRDVDLVLQMVSKPSEMLRLKFNKI